MTLSNNPRLLLAALRDGDYAHPGEEEAIDIVLDHLRGKLSAKHKLRILDVGCGLGGTAAYIYKHIPSEVRGIDLDTTAIEHAKSTYPEVNFTSCDILQINKQNMPKFDLIYLFNVFYALSEQLTALKELHRAADNGAVLVIFDYVALNPDKKIQIQDLAGKAMNLVSIEILKTYLVESGWQLLEIINLNNEYYGWYQNFLNKLKQSKITLLEKFTEEAYEKVLFTFSSLLNEIENKTIGGLLIYAKKQI